jgi:hypothetical protein
VDLNHSDTSDEDSVEVIELLIEFSDECHEWYLNLCVSTHYISNKRYFNNYRQINNYIISTVTNNLFSIERIEII